MHSLQQITLALGFFASAALANGGLGIMPRSVLTSVSGLEARQLTCTGSNPNICEQTANTIKCGQNCCSDGTSCEFGYSCQSGGRCCDERYPVSQCGVATLCYDATDAKCPNAEECCPPSTPFCVYEGGRALCQLSTTYTSTITNETPGSTSTSTSTSTFTSTKASSTASASTTTKTSATTEISTYTPTTAYTSTTHVPTSSVSTNATSSSNATAPTASTPPAFTGASGKNGVEIGIVAIAVAIGVAFF